MTDLTKVDAGVGSTTITPVDTSFLTLVRGLADLLGVTFSVTSAGLGTTSLTPIEVSSLLWRQGTGGGGGGVGGSFSMNFSRSFTMNTFAPNDTSLGFVLGSPTTGVTYSLGSEIGAAGFAVDAITGELTLKIDWQMLDNGALHQLGASRSFSIIGTNGTETHSTTVNITLDSSPYLAKMPNGVPGVDIITGRTNTTPLKKPLVDPWPDGWFLRLDGRSISCDAGAPLTGDFIDWDLRNYNLYAVDAVNPFTVSQCLFDAAWSSSGALGGHTIAAPNNNFLSMDHCTVDMNGHYFRTYTNGLSGTVNMTRCSIVAAPFDAVDLGIAGGVMHQNYLSVACSANTDDGFAAVTPNWSTWGHSDGIQWFYNGLQLGGVTLTENYIDDRMSPTGFDLLTGTSLVGSGTITATAGTNQIVGTGTHFTTDKSYGHTINLQIDDPKVSFAYPITAIADDTHLTIGDADTNGWIVRDLLDAPYRVGTMPNTGVTSPWYFQGPIPNVGTLQTFPVTATNNMFRGGGYTVVGGGGNFATVGTITTVAGNATITGSGTLWLTGSPAGQRPQAGWYITYPGCGLAPALIASVDSDTQITVVAGTEPTVSGSGMAYRLGGVMLAPYTYNDNIVDVGIDGLFGSNGTSIFNNNVALDGTPLAADNVHGFAIPPAPTLNVSSSTSTSITLTVGATGAARFDYRMRTPPTTGTYGAWTDSPGGSVTFNGLTSGTAYEWEWRGKNVPSDDMVTYFQTGSSAAISATATASAALPLDGLSTPASGAYSTQRLRTAYTGPAIQVRRDSDNHLMDIGFAGNDLDVDALLQFCGAGGGGYVTIWYDQSGNGRDFIQLTSATLQPQIVSGGALLTLANGKPKIVYNNATSTNLHAPDLTLADFFTTTDYTIMSSWEATAGGSAGTAWANPAILSCQFGAYLVHGGISATRGAFEVDHSDPGDEVLSVPLTFPSGHIAFHQCGGGTMSLCLDGGTLATKAVGALGSMADHPVLGGNNNSSVCLDGSINELVLFAAAISKADANSLGAAMSARAGKTWTAIP